MLTRLYLLYLRLCLFQAQPQDVPHSQIVFCASLGGTLLVAWLSALLLGNDGIGAGFWFGLTRSVLIGGMLWLLLGLFGRTARWLQSASAIYGCGAVITGLSLPFVTLLPAQPGGMHSILWLLVLGFGLWQFVVITRILRAALESGFGLAVGMTMLLEIAPVTLIYTLFPELLGPIPESVE